MNLCVSSLLRKNHSTLYKGACSTQRHLQKWFLLRMNQRHPQSRHTPHGGSEESGLLRMNQRERHPQSRHTSHGGSEKPAQRKVKPVSEIWGWAWAGTVAMDRSMCALLPDLLPPWTPRRGILSTHLSLPPPSPSVPRIPHPQFVPLFFSSNVALYYYSGCTK